jgi:NAD(P)H-flavin reductase
VYLIDEIRELSQNYDVDYHVSLSRPEADDCCAGIDVGRVADLAFERHQSMKNWGVYLCGGEGFIKSCQRSAFLAGASFSDIHSDAFVPST